MGILNRLLDVVVVLEENKVLLCNWEYFKKRSICLSQLASSSSILVKLLGNFSNSDKDV